MKYSPHAYQDHATQHVLKYTGCGLFMDMGLGKTVATLTAIVELMKLGEVTKTLVVAPLKVVENVWPAEIEKWDHLKHLKMSLIIGDESDRIRALQTKADIYVTNVENLVWLIARYSTAFPYDFLVIDELSKFKNPNSQRFKALRMIRPRIKRVVGLTGTPMPHSYLDLWSQLYLLDQGERLGEKFVEYRKKYFVPDARNKHIVYSYKMQKDKDLEAELLGDDIREKIIAEKISDICISMTKRDYLDLPDRIDRTIEIRLPSKIMQQYEEFERSQVLRLFEEGTEITAVNRAALTNKLLQFANGAIYDENHDYVVVHDEKLEMIREMIEVATSPVLIAYSFIHDQERLLKYLKEFKPVTLKKPQHFDSWNRGEIRAALLHPASGGHGLNLQFGGYNSMWFGVPWNLERYQQFVARLDRQGQIYSVVNQRLISQYTMDESALSALEGRTTMQDELMRVTNAIIEKHIIRKVA